MAARTTVVLSQGQSHNPRKRKLEETLVAELMMAEGIDVLVIPHLYDLQPDSSAIVALQGLRGDFLLLSWLYARAAHWTLDRHNIRGQMGATSLRSAWDERTKKWEKQTKEFRPDEGTPRVLDSRVPSDRTIFHLDLRVDDDAQAYVAEIQRLAADRRTEVVGLNAGLNGSLRSAAPPQYAASAPPTQEAARRWYPVIDYSRCTNCMECIDFCLFGVYGIDQRETILVEQPDNCRKGCPACSRVCPENAIIFPQHKTPAIAGDPAIGSEMKIDLSQLFGKPNDLETAAKERDEQLRLAGLGPAEAGPAIAQYSTTPASQSKDELDELIDELDELDL